MRFSRFFGSAAIAAAALIPAGCYLFESQVGPVPISLKNKPYTAIWGAGKAELRDGRLIVAVNNNSGDPERSQGIAVIDTGTGVIVDYFVTPRGVDDFVFLPDGRIAVAGSGGEEWPPETRYPEQGVLTLIDLATRKMEREVMSLGSSAFGSRLLLNGDTLYHLMGYAGTLRSHKIGAWRLPLFEATLYTAGDSQRRIVDFKAWRDKLILSRRGGSSLTVLDVRQTYGGPPDSIDVSALLWPGFEEFGPLAVRGDELFVVLKATASDTERVAVIDLPARTVKRVIRSNLPGFPTVGGVVKDGIWYLWGNGIQSLDLSVATQLEMRVSAASVAGQIYSFNPMTPSTGWLTRSGPSWRPIFQKITY